jgi:RNA polymerase sigma-70 factor (ECF subfamily)
MKRQPDTIGAEDIYSDILPELATNTDKQQADEIQVREIKQYFDKLPEAQRLVVESLFDRDLTHQEAAIELNIPLGTLKSRLRLALNKLREHIGVQA